jgi:hypothetical protein
MLKKHNKAFVGSNPTPRTTTLKSTEGLQREMPSVFSVFSLSEKLVSVEVAEDARFGH